jgi:NADH:ubiquinone oxidoreductase subunit 3 (subunit A)
METADQRYWIFIIALVAVINGLGIVRLLTALSEYVKKRAIVSVRHYSVYMLYVVFQLLIHLLFWWSIVGLHKVAELNFLNYLYLLIGPTLLFLSTTILIPDITDDSIDLRSQYYSVRKSFFSFMSAFYLWAIFIWPAFGHSFAPTVPLVLIFFLIALISRITDHPRVHAALIIANYAVYLTFIVLFAVHESDLARKIVEH